MSTARQRYRDTLQLSGLVTPEQLEKALAAVRAAAIGPPLPDNELSDELLAAKLVEQGVLTTYQSDQIKSGRTKFTLGPYVIKDWIGQGGMGLVFKGEHPIMGREVAIKVLPRNKSTPDSIASFTREIRTQAKLDHPHLVRAYDAGHDGDVYYLVCEYVPGTDLRRLVRTRKPLTMQQAAKIIRQAAIALDYAHQRGLIHRDVKPGNILVTPDGVAKVSDLGLASCLEDADTDPRAGKVVGTADYLSPEQVKDPHSITAASDVYSLGCTLYYAVTGKVPFPGGTPREKARRHCESMPMHPRRVNPELSEEFVEVIADMMAKDPQKRIGTGGETAARLEPWAMQASSVPTEQLVRSPWMVPALPTGGEEDLDETDDGEGESPSSDPPADVPSQASQPTDISDGSQETVPTRRTSPPVRIPAPALSEEEPPTAASSREQLLWIALGVAIPAAMILGSLLMYLFLALTRRG